VPDPRGLAGFLAHLQDRPAERPALDAPSLLSDPMTVNVAWVVALSAINRASCCLHPRTALLISFSLTRRPSMTGRFFTQDMIANRARRCRYPAAATAINTAISTAKVRYFRISEKSDPIGARLRDNPGKRAFHARGPTLDPLSIR
jgi:hypothetical protein